MSALPNFRIETSETGSATTIRLGGELDSGTCNELVSRFEQLPGGAAPEAAERGLRELVLDLSEVTFIDSSGMRVIIMVERSAAERGFDLTIVPPPDALTDLLQVTGVADRARLAPQASDARPTAPFVERIELELAREPTAPARARAELREALGPRLSETDRATVTLLTSELVTNAVIHPGPEVGGAVGLRITAFHERVRIEVSDAGGGFDAAAPPTHPREAGGHGLVVVDGLSSRWGTSRVAIDDDDGFCVWFELDVGYDLAAAPEPPEQRAAAAEG